MNTATNETSNAKGPEVLYGVRETLDPLKWQVAAHTHPHHELLVLMRGHQCTRTKTGELAAGAGEVLFFPAGRVHEEWLVQGESVVKYTLGFNYAAELHDLPPRLSDAKGRITELAEWISSEVPKGHPSEVGIPEPLLHGLVSELKRAAERDGPVLRARARAVLQRDMRQIQSVDGLARALGLSRSHLSRRFVAEVGEPPSEFIRAARLKEARRLLLTTNMAVKEVAAAVGISSEQQLCRLVRKETGMTTRQLRAVSH